MAIVVWVGSAGHGHRGRCGRRGRGGLELSLSVVMAGIKSIRRVDSDCSHSAADGVEQWKRRGERWRWNWKKGMRR